MILTFISSGIAKSDCNEDQNRFFDLMYAKHKRDLTSPINTRVSYNFERVTPLEVMERNRVTNLPNSIIGYLADRNDAIEEFYNEVNFSIFLRIYPSLTISERELSDLSDYSFVTNMPIINDFYLLELSAHRQKIWCEQSYLNNDESKSCSDSCISRVCNLSGHSNRELLSLLAGRQATDILRSKLESQTPIEKQNAPDYLRACGDACIQTCQNRTQIRSSSGSSGEKRISNEEGKNQDNREGKSIFLDHSNRPPKSKKAVGDSL